MTIRFNTDALRPMLDWLSKRKKTGSGDEARLRQILALPDYQVEFERYSSPGIPVCGINFEEAVDFFMNFDRKDFENQRLQYKKAYFERFYGQLESRAEGIAQYASVGLEDCELIERLLKNALPDDLLADISEFNIILIVSIGNSMGWPFGHYVDYDVANLTAFGSREDFLHLTAHEIHHIFVGQMLGAEGISGADFFLQNFAYEGLAVHYMNNLATPGKPAKYDGPVRCMDSEDMAFYEAHFDEIFGMIRKDYYRCLGGGPDGTQERGALTLDEVSQLVSDHYEQFEFMGKPVRQYPTYYFGCYMWGLVDLHFGKEKLFEALARPGLFVQLYNSVAEEKYRL